jgi:ribonuclease E
MTLGRAVNDPRVAPKPVGKIEVRTERSSLFPAEQMPAIAYIARDVPRASNDPRGASAAGDNAQNDAPVTEDLFQGTGER